MSLSTDDHNYEDYQSDSSEPIRHSMRTRNAKSTNNRHLRSATTDTGKYYNCIQCGALTNSSWHLKPDHPDTTCLDCTRALVDKFEYVEQTPRKRLMRKSDFRAVKDGLDKDDTAGDTGDDYVRTNIPQRVGLRRNSNNSDTGSMIMVDDTKGRGTTRPGEADPTAVSKQLTVNSKGRKEQARKRVEVLRGAEFMRKLEHIENAGKNVWVALRQLLLLPQAENFTSDQILQALKKAGHAVHTGRKADAHKLWKAQLGEAAVRKVMEWIKDDDRSFLNYEPDTAAILAQGWRFDTAGFIVDTDSEYAVVDPAVPGATSDGEHMPSLAKESAQAFPKAAARPGFVVKAGSVGRAPFDGEGMAAKFYSFTRAADGQALDRATVDAAVSWKSGGDIPGAYPAQQAPEISSQKHWSSALTQRSVPSPIQVADDSRALVLATDPEQNVNSLDDLKKLELSH